MRQNLFFFLVWVIGLQSTTAQDKNITKDIEGFTEIKVFDGLSVNLIKSDVNKAVISGANASEVAVVNNDGVLKLRMQINKIFSGYRTFIDVHYTEQLRIVDVNEDARIISNDVIKQDVIELKAQEGGEVSLSAEVEQMLIKSVTGGVIKTKGSSNLQDVVVNTGGIYEGKEFETKFSTINVNAGSKAHINASEYVNAVVKAGGEVLVYGNPDKVEEKTVFGGKIIRQ